MRGGVQTPDLNACMVASLNGEKSTENKDASVFMGENSVDRSKEKTFSSGFQMSRKV